jgi:ribose transport system ATP-binding protein
MIGRTLLEAFPPRGTERGEPVLTVRGLTSRGVLRDVDIEVCRGEIVGLAGLMGSGRTELAQAIFGARPFERGQVFLNSRPLAVRSPADAMRHKVGYLTEDRKAEGLVIELPLRHNAALPSLDRRQRWGLINVRSETGAVAAKTQELRIRTPSLDQEAQYLSGGNQQKVVLAKWLICGPDLLIFDEPTRGIDIGAKNEIWSLMRALANQGTAILMISSELPEIIGMSDRVVVMHRGQVAGALPGAEATEEAVMMLATYGEAHV